MQALTSFRSQRIQRGDPRGAACGNVTGQERRGAEPNDGGGEGTPDLRTYQKTDGTQGVSLTLRVFTVQLLGSRNSNEAGGSDSYNSGSSGSMSGVPAAGELTTPVDDLPF